MKPTLPRDYFDSLYSQNPDPWHFATKEYEHRKYGVTLANLPRQHYGNTLELGCSIGVLSQQLSQRTDQLLAIDVAEAALQQARERCADTSNVRFERLTLPQEFPSGQFDLILMSEVGYYFALPELKILSEKVLDALTPDGNLVLVHYLPIVPDYPLTGDEVHQFFLNLPSLEHIYGFRAPRYRFDNFQLKSI